MKMLFALCFVMGHLRLSLGQDVRLVGGFSPNEGRVEVYHDGQWGTVCDDHWDDNDASVVCRQLGLTNSGSSYCCAGFGQGVDPIWLDDVSCSGSESNIADCGNTGWVVQNCRHSEDAGVKCGKDVRLVGGSSPNEGRVEVYHYGQWGTVCDHFWDDNDAAVVCRQLGLGDSGTAVKWAGFGEGEGPIWLDDVNCLGSERNIADCGNNGWGVENCGHEADAGVRCGPVLRLVGGSSPNEGRVEVYHDGQWGTVCDDSWDDNAAAVVCRQLGLSVSGTAVCCAGFRQGVNPIWLDNVTCTGSESNIATCGNNGWGIHNCGHENDASVKCGTAIVRLSGGQTANEGRVEVFVNDEWGTICDDRWYNVDAGVVCRQLGAGYTSGLARTGATFGPGEGTIQLDDVECTGTEPSVLYCPHAGVGVHNCAHREDAGVVCHL